MAMFKCEECGCAENTAMSNYWIAKGEGTKKLCSECDPLTGAWHGRFPKLPAAGRKLASDGFVYSQAEIDGHLAARIAKGQLSIIGDA